jgi:Na+/phosphate symporter
LLAQRPRSVVVACFVGAAFFMFRGARRADLRGAAALGYACMALGLAVVWLIFYGSV